MYVKKASNNKEHNCSHEDLQINRTTKHKDKNINPFALCAQVENITKKTYVFKP